MATPKSVARALQEADAIQQSLAQQAAVPTDVVDDVSQLAAQPQVTAPAPAPVQPAPAPAVDWEQKFKSLQGMYNAEMPRLQAQAKTYESEVTALKEQVRALTQAARKEPPKADQKDIENFGSDMIEMVRRYAEQTFEHLRGEFEARIAAIEGQISGVSKKAEVSIGQQFYSTLQALVPDWKEINTDARWLQWLDEVDPLFGAPRQAALDAAHQALDAQRVAAVFNQFKRAVPQPKQETLASQVAPAASGGAAPVEAQAQPKRRISQKFVQQFYNDVARLKYVGREAEAARIEQEINEAAAEGRIV